MSDIDYLLVVLTHGDSAPLAECLGSFGRHVTPAPAYAYYHRDGPVETIAVPSVCDEGWIDVSHPPLGFCGATARAWDYAAESDHDYVFWLEHDFVFTRDVDLNLLAHELDRRRTTLAQMALMREAVNVQELAAGGLYESRVGEYTPKDGWLEHRSYFTTNPSLMRRSFLYDNPWPAEVEQCEGRFGIDLLSKAWSFAVWGNGEPWVRHIGTRTGFGY